MIANKKYTMRITEEDSGATLFKAVEGKCYQIVPYMDEEVSEIAFDSGDHEILLLNIERVTCYVYHINSNRSFRCAHAWLKKRILSVNYNKIWNQVNA